MPAINASLLNTSAIANVIAATMPGTSWRGSQPA